MTRASQNDRSPLRCEFCITTDAAAHGGLRISSPIDDNWNDSEYPQPEDCTPDDAEADEIPCPNCKQMIYEEAEQCRHCGEWVVAGLSNWGILGLLLVALVILSFVMAVVF